jgi:antitoxin component of MazEF toxin-antitoxin module
MLLITATPRNKNGSMSFTIPAEVVRELGIKHEDQYQVIIQGRQIVFAPVIA